PAFISTDRNGGDARELMDGCFTAPGEALTAVFLKGYQWPFDARKAKAGSSRIDLLVQNEIARGRRVFLDFRVNPFGDRFALSALEDEAKDYLLRAGATQDTPFARLLHMNAPAVDFYRSHGVDLAHDRLEIAVCAQHMNGGIAVDEWWQSGLSGLYVIGEAAGTHGVYRPGGSALNAGQAGAARAARAISRAPEQAPAPLDEADALNAVRRVAAACRGNTSNLDALNTENAARMSACAGAVRRPEAIRALLEDTTSLLQHFEDTARYRDERELGTLFRLRDALITRRAMLTAMLDYAAHGGGNRGSAIYEPEPRNAADLTGQVQEVCLTEDSVVCRWRAVKPIPEEDDFFENVWREYRQGKW
ncbi:MAG: oxidoreductase, partial [Clostridia bacterium]|nr:oxidoreductase [Clostridia bacterium]